MNAHTKMIIFIDNFGLSNVSHCSEALRSSNDQFVGKVRQAKKMLAVMLKADNAESNQ